MAPACAWDLDGTLVDSVADICFHVNQALGSLGLAARPDADIRGHVGRGASVLLQGVLADQPQATVEAATAAFRRSYLAQPVIHTRAYPGARDALLHLRSLGIPSVVVTNKPHDVAIAVVRGVGLLDAVHSVHGAAPGVPHKPDPSMLRAAVHAVDATPGTTVMVGDSTVDLETARAFGCAFVGVGHGIDGGRGLRAAGIALVNGLGDAAVEVVRALGGAA